MRGVAGVGGAPWRFREIAHFDRFDHFGHFDRFVLVILNFFFLYCSLACANKLKFSILFFQKKSVKAKIKFLNIQCEIFDKSRSKKDELRMFKQPQHL